jgi:chromosome segregation ATPase
MSPSKDNSINPSTEPHLLSYLNSQRSPRKTNAGGLPSTPSSKNLLTLLDFELPPAPTPRSVPTISARELESLKSNYASQISALKATLSGREAEVEALKRAVGDAERRVGEATEELREQRGRRECAEREKEEWENRGAEFEDVLKRVKKEVLEGEREREEVLSRAEDAEERVRELEARLADSEERVRKAESAKTDKTSVSSVADSDSRGPLFTAEQVQRQIDEKVHALSTELHAIYKKKHVTKVAGLKKGFEAKTKEKTMELSAQIDKLERQNDDLQAKLDGTLSGVVPGLVGLDGISNEQRDAELKKLEEQKTIIERQKAELAGREEELKAQRAEYSIVMNELERERVEKGELVAAVDEMLALQSDMSVVHAAASEPSTAPIVEEALRKSIGLGAPRASGLAKPGFGFGSRLAKPTIGKSRMMSQIEKMGGGGRSAE